MIPRFQSNLSIPQQRISFGFGLNFNKSVVPQLIIIKKSPNHSGIFVDGDFLEEGGERNLGGVGKPKV